MAFAKIKAAASVLCYDSTMSTVPKPNLDIPITTFEQLTDFFHQGARLPEDWGIGAEMEKLVIDARTGETAEFARIEQLLNRLADQGGWQRIVERGSTIGLKGPHSSVTLEPGGQLELSGQLCPDLCCNYGDYLRYVTAAVAIGRDLGLMFLGLGAQPFTPLENIAWVPKARYGIMGPYMTRTGDMGQRMMKQSAGLQVNLDFSDEADCMAKMRLVQAMAPLLFALFANSPILEDRPTGFLSTRGEIWSRTDNDRTGLLPFLEQPDAGFRDYVNYALHVPMYMIIRNGRYIDLTQERFSFDDYLQRGYQNHRPTLSDWDTHLSTLFPEVRLRPQIEVRSADSLPPHMALTVAAFLKGILYDRQSRELAWELCRAETFEQLNTLCRAAWQDGLQAAWRQGTLHDLARECLALAQDGLDRQSQQWQHGINERQFLDSLVGIVDSGVTLAETLLRQWQGDRQAKMALLEQHCGFPGKLGLAESGDCAEPTTD
jgi:glutamate--cysteine ligase